MFSKVLIANRGTIRAKCVQAVKELGAKAAVFYTEQDNMSHGVRMADEAHALPGSDPMRAYYDADRIVELAASIGADAVHPGYGFLAENLEFAKALAERNIKFIGPDEKQLERLINKPLMKQEAAKASLKTVPGSAPCPDFARLQAAAQDIGYPLVLKPVSSSGGTGMSIIFKESELKNAYDGFLNRSERFKLSIRDIFVEKYLKDARHIEFPILRDINGNTLVLPEVEASVQRRFQKLLVESPSPLEDRKLIRELAALSRRFIDKLEYVGLASVEFLVVGKIGYFIEMNTYIPPWHAVVSQLSDVDIVREHMRILSGQSLSVLTGDPNPRGHVIGVSVNAEDPSKDFVPCPGMLSQFEAPLATGATIYATAKSGDAVSSFYEPVLAQVVAVDSSRSSAIKKLSVTLSEFIIEGVKTNLPFLRALLNAPSFESGKVNLSLLSDKDSLKELLENTSLEVEEDIAAIIAALTLHGDANSEQIISAAGRAAEGFSIWNFTSRLLNRSSLED